MNLVSTVCRATGHKISITNSNGKWKVMDEKGIGKGSALIRVLTEI